MQTSQAASQCRCRQTFQYCLSTEYLSQCDKLKTKPANAASNTATAASCRQITAPPAASTAERAPARAAASCCLSFLGLQSGLCLFQSAFWHAAPATAAAATTLACNASVQRMTRLSNVRPVLAHCYWLRWCIVHALQPACVTHTCCCCLAHCQPPSKTPRPCTHCNRRRHHRPRTSAACCCHCRLQNHLLQVLRRTRTPEKGPTARGGACFSTWTWQPATHVAIELTSVHSRFCSASQTGLRTTMPAAKPSCTCRFRMSAMKVVPNLLPGRILTRPAGWHIHLVAAV